MAAFRKKPIVIKAFTWDEFVAHGREEYRKRGVPLIRELPWNFDFLGHPITHENDTCYLIPTLEGTHNFTADDMLIVGIKGEIYPCKRDIFEATYEAVGELPVFGALDFQELAALTNAGNVLQGSCHALSKSAGWWYHAATGLDLIAVINEPEDALDKLLAGALVAQKLCLSHSEISEAMEGHRKGLMDDKLPHRPMIEVEIADAIIRLCDLAGALNLNLGGAIAEKLAFNQKRPDHKPENRAKEGGKSY